MTNLATFRPAYRLWKTAAQLCSDVDRFSVAMTRAGKCLLAFL
jgi:hypothetical protein